MFRNLGEVLVACHFPSQYARISVETQGGANAPARACLKTLGFTYDGLAKAIGKHWKLPSDDHARCGRRRKTAASTI